MGFKRVIIKAKYIRVGEGYYVKIGFPYSNRTLIRGVVYNPDLTVSSGAAIGVVEVDLTTCKRKFLGYVFTNDLGEYGIVIQAQEYKDYEICVYSPLN